MAKLLRIGSAIIDLDDIHIAQLEHNGNPVVSGVTFKNPVVIQFKSDIKTKLYFGQNDSEALRKFFKHNHSIIQLN